MNNDRFPSLTVIVADGTFPTHDIPLRYLKNAVRIISCDGSAENLVRSGYVPDAIVGDIDSLGADLKKKFADRIFKDGNQDTNDLTKAVEWCRKKSYNELIIIGATGKREDHTLGNISLLAEYAADMNVRMVTDTGTFIPYLKSCSVASFPHQQVSIFSLDPETEITSAGLKFQLNHLKLSNWWMATLNEALEDSFSLEFNNGRVLVFLNFET